jgi:Flp pilus assembly protein TadG
MIERLIKGFARTTRLEDERGGAIVELALCMSMLLVLVFGLIEFSQIIFDYEVMSGLSRQGSNLASRGGYSLKQAADAVVIQGASLNIGTNGRVIVTEVANNSSGQPAIVNQGESSPGISVNSMVGSGNGNAATMPLGTSAKLATGQAIYVTEIFYAYKPITPLGAFLKVSLAHTLYETAYF